MNQDRTSAGIREKLNVTRKTFDVYERYGLIKAGLEECIHDEKIMERIIKIRFYQKLGFSISQIKRLLNSYDEQIKEVLINKKEEIKNELDSLYRKQSIIDSIINSSTKPDIEYMLQIVMEEDR